MEEQDLLLTLEKLEESLGSVDSARKQVEQTVKAYGDTEIKISEYTNRLKNVSENINTLIGIIKDDRTSFATTIEKSTNDKMKKLDHEIEEFKNAVGPLVKECKAMTSSFNTDTRESINNVKESLNAASGEMQAAFKSSLTSTAKEQSAELHKGITEIVSTTKQQLQGVHADGVQAVTATVDNIKTSCSDTLKQFNDSCNITSAKVATLTGKATDKFQKTVQSFEDAIKTTMDNLNNAIDCISDFQKVVNAAITSQIQPVEKKQNAIQNSIVTINGKLSVTQNSINNLKNEINKLQNELATLTEQNKKLNVVIIALLAILLIFMFFK